MIKIEGTRESLTSISKHIYICDLINVEGPILCLYKDDRTNWIYHWCDTDGLATERWAIFPVERSLMVEYFSKQKSLLDLYNQASSIRVLDSTNEAREEGSGKRSKYRLLRRVGYDHIGAYLPSPDSYFDESLTDDISLAQQVVPTRFNLPIDGTWFLRDVDRFARSYTRLYSFFYCTGPRFVNSIGEKVRDRLHAPWAGGFSRINMFDALHKLVPSVHDTRVTSYQYASKGNITVEALGSVGDSVRNVVLAFVKNADDVTASSKAIDEILHVSKLKKSNLSSASDANLGIADHHIRALIDHTNKISALLSVSEEVADLCRHAPNSVVVAKVSLALLTQVRRIAEFEQWGLLEFGRDSQTPMIT